MRKKLLKMLLSSKYNCRIFSQIFPEKHKKFSRDISMDRLREKVKEPCWLEFEDELWNLVSNMKECSFEAGVDVACILLEHEPIYDCLQFD